MTILTEDAEASINLNNTILTTLFSETKASRRLIKFAVGDCLEANKVKNYDLPVTEFLQSINFNDNVIREDKKKSVPYITSYCKNGMRNKDNMPFRYWLMLDFDNVKAVTKEPVYSDFEVFKSEIAKSLESYQYVIHTTFSHTEVIPKLRVVIVLSEPVAKKDYKQIATAFIEETLSEKLIEALDTDASTDYAKVMLLPAKSSIDYTPWRHFKEEGAEIDVSKYKLLAANSNTKLGKRGRPPKAISQATDDLTIFCNNQPLDITDDEVLELLNNLPAAYISTYDNWLKVGFALHHQYQGNIKGLDVFLQFSKQDPEKYDEAEATKKWDSFSLNNPNPITLASLLHLAKEDGIPWADINKQNKPKATLDNFRILLKTLGVTTKFNLLKHTIDISFRNQIIPVSSLHNKQNDDITDILSLCIKYNFIQNKNLVSDYTNRVANENPYNPLKIAIESTVWDGISRINNFYEKVIVSPEYENIKRIYLRKWLLQFIYMNCFNDEKRPLVARQVLVFSGKQHIGKTTWFKNLLPDKLDTYSLAGQKLNLENEMSKKNCLEHALVELGELASTFKKSDQDDLKSFLSADTDKINVKFVATHQTFRRRTCFFASVNDSNFLQDKTGSTRFLVLPVLALKRETLDMMQLYAELLHHEKSTNNFTLREEAYELNQEERLTQDGINKIHTSLCPVEEELYEYFDFSQKPSVKYLTATSIFTKMRGVDFKRPNKKELNDLSTILDSKCLKNNRTYILPPPKNLFSE